LAEQDPEVSEKVEDRLSESAAVLKELLSGKTGIPGAIIAKAKCIIVIPGVKKFATGFGVSYGRGAMTCHQGEDYKGRWGAPAMYALEGGNFGLQFGLQGTDLVLVVVNERGVDSLLRSKIRLGGDASVSAGPIGRNMQAATDLGMKAEILSYSRSRGVFAGVAIEGSTLRPDNYANSILYNRDEITARQIVRGRTTVPAQAKDLIAFLNENAYGDQASTQARAERDK